MMITGIPCQDLSCEGVDIPSCTTPLPPGIVKKSQVRRSADQETRDM